MSTDKVTKQIFVNLPVKDLGKNNRVLQKARF